VRGWGESVIKLCVGKILETMYSTFLPWVVYLLYMLYFKMSCVYCCELSCVYCCSCLVCIVVILCVFAVLCVYCCFYFRCRTFDYKSVFGRSCDRPPRHRFFLVSLCLQANAEMVPKIPSCHYNASHVVLPT